MIAFLFSGTLLLSALLLFVLEPMFGKMALPLLGGSPAVWNTCMLFFQGMLLVGYLYAHFGARLIGSRRHAALHLGLLGLSLFLLPIRLITPTPPPTATNPIPWLLVVLTISLAAPFVLLSSTGPLLQAWFARLGHPDSGDPYFLYAASNTGSLAGLVAYPFLIEPVLRLGWQSRVWTGGYLVLVTLTAACAAAVWRSDRRFRAISQEPQGRGGECVESRIGGLTWAFRFRVLALAFVPSSLLLGLTTYLTMDIAAVPLLWVIPLAFYLATFVLVFARHPPIPLPLIVRWQPLLVIPVVVFLFWGPYLASPLLLPAHLAAFVVTSMVCHGELARSRPPTPSLTEFFAWIALGGLLGGVFNVLVAPLLFASVEEYPLLLAVGLALRPRGSGVEARRVGMIAPLGLLTLLPARYWMMAVDRPGVSLPVPAVAVALAASGIAAVVCYRLRDRPLQLALAAGYVVLAGVLVEAGGSGLLLRQRDFYGVHQVKQDDRTRIRILINGTTKHGAQSTDPGRRRDPLSYYTRSGPLGDIFRAAPSAGSRSVGVIGLGTGAAAAYAQAGDRWTFFELDPAVQRIAVDPRFFTYLQDAPVRPRVVLGDGRISLGREPDRAFDLIVLDAFSSDAIPVHLLTREALRIYVAKLAPGGVLAFHVSNRFLDLEPVLAALAEDAGLQGCIRVNTQLGQARAEAGEDASIWAVLGRMCRSLGGLASEARWRPLRMRGSATLWTDDFSNVARAFRFLEH